MGGMDLVGNSQYWCLREIVAVGPPDGPSTILKATLIILTRKPETGL